MSLHTTVRLNHQGTNINRVYKINWGEIKIRLLTKLSGLPWLEWNGWGAPRNAIRLSACLSERVCKSLVGRLRGISARSGFIYAWTECSRNGPARETSRIFAARFVVCARRVLSLCQSTDRLEIQIIYFKWTVFTVRNNFTLDSHFVAS